MRYIVGFTQAPGVPPFYAYESEMAPPVFPLGSKVLAAPPETSSEWLQVMGVAFQFHDDVIVTTVVVGDVTNVGGDSQPFLTWPWH